MLGTGAILLRFGASKIERAHKLKMKVAPTGIALAF